LGDLENFVRQQDPEKLKKVFLVHGEAASMEYLKTTLDGHHFHHVEIPERGSSYEM
jgi:metallo-beta-lactamase family protein